MEQELYAQVIMIRQRESDDKKEKIKKYNFQGKSAAPRRLFELDHEWLEESFRARERVFYKKCTKIIFGVMIQFI